MFPSPSIVLLVLLKLGDSCEASGWRGRNQEYMGPRRAKACAPFCFLFSEFYGRMNQKSLLTELTGSSLRTSQYQSLLTR